MTDKSNNHIVFLLRLGDNSLILGHRLSEWCGHGPILEEDIAMTNIALDLIGQCRLIYQEVARIQGDGITEDDLAYKRDVFNYRNAYLCEQPNGDFAQTMIRQFFFASWQYHLLNELKNSKDEFLSSFSNKALKEVSYHLRHTREWMLRLGDGTDESRERLIKGLDWMWRYSGELLELDKVENELIKTGIIPNLAGVKQNWTESVTQCFNEVNIDLPENAFMISGGRNGNHSEHLGYILAEMQFLPRAYPDATW